MTAVKRPLVALGGNPNAGKTTLFNVLTGSRARVGNYPGVTVERRMGQARLPELGAVDVLDVPGTYSLVARTGEEQVAIDALLGLAGERRPDAVVLCVDSTQLVRGLYLANNTQLYPEDRGQNYSMRMGIAVARQLAAELAGAPGPAAVGAASEA